MLHDLLRALIASPNLAADDVLVDALRVGQSHEQPIIMAALLARKSVRGLSGVIELYEKLPERLQVDVLENIGEFHPAIRECARSEVPERRISAMKIIAHGRQGRLSYVLGENLHSGDERFSKAAAGAMSALARWVVRSTRLLQSGGNEDSSLLIAADSDVASTSNRKLLHQQIIENRKEIEEMIVRAVELHRGSRQQELLNAALILCDSTASAVLSILTTSRHGGQNIFARKVQLTPDVEHVPAFLVAGAYGGLRSHFGQAFSKIDQGNQLDALLRKTHWLIDNNLLLCVKQVTSGGWMDEPLLAEDLARRTPAQSAMIGNWVLASGLSDAQVDARLLRVTQTCGDNTNARARILRAIFRHRRLTPETLRHFTHDSNERLVRMAVREFIRQRPPELENHLLPLMSDAPESVRRIVSRTVGQAGFDSYWDRFDRMEKSLRRQAGRAMLKLLPDTTDRLARKISSGPTDDRIRAMQIAFELDLIEPLRDKLFPLCSHGSPRVRSKAVTLLATLGVSSVDMLLEKAATDPDARVRANAIEVMEERGPEKFVSVLSDRARSGQNRERANAIKAMHRMRTGVVHDQLLEMLRDDRPEHRISALWCLRRIGWWKLLREVAQLARDESNVRVKRYAMSILQSATLEIREKNRSLAA